MIHALADVKTPHIGDNSNIWQFVVILSGAKIGQNCNINCHTFIEGDVVLGDNVTVKSGVYLWNGIRIEDDVFIGPSVTFVNDPFPRSKVYPDRHKGATIRKGASLGANATIMGNLEIGEYAMIGAGSVVIKSVPPFTLWYGNPAKHMGFVTKEGETVNLDLIGKDEIKYSYIENKLIKIDDSVS